MDIWGIIMMYAYVLVPMSRRGLQATDRLPPDRDLSIRYRGRRICPAAPGVRLRYSRSVSFFARPPADRRKSRKIYAVGQPLRDRKISPNLEKVYEIGRSFPSEMTQKGLDTRMSKTVNETVTKSAVSSGKSTPKKSPATATPKSTAKSAAPKAVEKKQAPVAENAIDGEKFQKMMASAANSLDSEKTEINNLNVFPVPDGDTGINMSLTMKPARDIQVEPGTLAEAASNVANRLLRAARGNSGAILSLFFRGMAKSFEGLDKADNKDIAKAIRSGTDEAYRAVSKPAEGTILTVMRGTAETAEAEAEKEEYRDNPEAFFGRLVESAEDVLAQTPEMLPVLKQANVVDAGGQGFVTMLKGMRSSLQGNDVAAVEGSDSTEESADFGEFDTESILFAYCTECIVGKSDEFRGEGTAAPFKELISGIGDSMVFVDDDEIIKLHIHTNDPGFVLSEAIKYGALEMVKIENMKRQHSALTAAGEKAKEKAEPAPAPAPVDYTPDRDFGFVAVCLGDGTANIFRELGVQEIVTGGQTMNPSTDDLLEAIRKTRGREVFVLPNNKNIIMVAQQAADIVAAEAAEGIGAQQKVIVLETRSVPEGMAAMLAFDSTASAEDNAAAMTETFGCVHTLSVTRAVKDASIDGLDIKAGEYMGLCDRKIAYTDVDCAVILPKMLAGYPDAAFVTVLYGCDVEEETANAVLESLQAVLPDAEFNLLRGGQPLYDYVISVE